MSEPTLRLLPVRRDLPALWDGRGVEWKGWTSGVTTARFHDLKPRCCERCASRGEESLNLGVVAPLPGATFDVHIARRLPSGREYLRTVAKDAWPIVQLVAFRCPDCRLDTVWDKETDEWWTLDESDYGDEGSTDPRLF